MTGLLLLALGGYFFFYASRYPEQPIPQAARIVRGKMVAAIGLLAIWYLLGGVLGAFLLDQFLGWEHLPIVISVLLGLGLVPLGDAFRRPIFFLWAFLIVMMAALLLIAAPDWHVFRAQVQGAWITLVLWTLALDQYRLNHASITGPAD